MVDWGRVQLEAQKIGSMLIEIFAIASSVISTKCGLVKTLTDANEVPEQI